MPTATQASIKVAKPLTPVFIWMTFSFERILERERERVRGNDAQKMVQGRLEHQAFAGFEHVGYLFSTR